MTGPVNEVPVEYELVKALREQVADEMTRAKQERERRGLPELSESDERQLACSLITAAVQPIRRRSWRPAGSCPRTPGMTCG